ncbi:asparagine synthase (glutamine-hydrolyzing) [Pseudanabaena sp. FACHB-2040]|uniref:asparagine synthase (glutamine-hydrolyzing) n=1 Tax=Pseudanabaena sp. FACHB-2040 TaxID=2692859 RepID=UPI001682BD8B|nr:asparagine synthase (glutamine-hydrolyzing) [Pseudanabaena sp. FACHB-2040]MBD2260785.1 asparagine synthase (glutamine-hydrolyzing) [Pseudanabaena sp. FACHB-2040]
MCGIVGILNRYEAQSSSLHTSLRCLHHRGPDDRGAWQDEYLQLGHTRLSILDLSPLGHQPMASEDGRYCISFNGEIYNYLELKQELTTLGHSFNGHSDTEVLLASFAQWSTACLDHLRGMFAFAIWDKETQNLFLGRDRFGEKPLYYWYDKEAFYFASELKALLPLLPTVPELDPVSIDLYFHYQYVPEPRTPLKGIHKLPAAHYLQISREDWKFTPQCYWSLENIPPVTGDPATLIRQELEKSIELVLRSDVPIGVALSGGIDSSAIAALAAPKYRDTLQTFSVGYPGRPAYDERNQAEALAKSLKLPFHDIELTTEALVDFFPSLVAAVDEPIADIAAYGHYSGMQLAASQGVKVMLSGVGGDELFWGYSWVARAARISELKDHYLQAPTWKAQGIRTLRKLAQHPLYQKLGQSKKVPIPIQSWFRPGIDLSQMTLSPPDRAVFYELSPDFVEALTYRPHLFTQSLWEHIPLDNPYCLFPLSPPTTLDIPNQISQTLFQTWLVSNCLSLGDRVSMACSIETRLPLLDKELAELVIGLRKNQPDHCLPAKAWLKSALKGILPNEVLDRPKRGFQPPVQEWMHAVVRENLETLTTGHLVELNILSKSFVQALRDEFSNKGRHTFMLYKAVVLEIWYRQIVLSSQSAVRI